LSVDCASRVVAEVLASVANPYGAHAPPGPEINRQLRTDNARRASGAQNYSGAQSYYSLSSSPTGRSHRSVIRSWVSHFSQSRAAMHPVPAAVTA